MSFSQPLAALGLLCLSGSLLAADAALVAPLSVRNFSPVAGLLGLPSQRSATPVSAGALQWSLQGAVASHYVADAGGAERLNLDGETQRLALDVRYALADNWELQLELPWLHQDAGFLDSAIDNWHDFWGMPDNGRGDVARDLIDYRYQDLAANPSQRFGLWEDSSGVGDVTLALQHTFYQRHSLSLAAAVGYKFGSGDREDFTGSGEGDGFVALRLSDPGTGAVGWYGQLGYLRAGEIAALGARQERDLWFAGAGVAWAFAPDWSVIGQFDAHAAPLDSAVDALGSEAMLLTAGLRWRLAPAWSLDFSVVEDIAVETAPDVTFQASLNYLGGE